MASEDLIDVLTPIQHALDSTGLLFLWPWSGQPSDESNVMRASTAGLMDAIVLKSQPKWLGLQGRPVRRLFDRRAFGEGAADGEEAGPGAESGGQRIRRTRLDRQVGEEATGRCGTVPPR